MFLNRAVALKEAYLASPLPPYTVTHVVRFPTCTRQFHSVLPPNSATRMTIAGTENPTLKSHVDETVDPLYGFDMDSSPQKNPTSVGSLSWKAKLAAQTISTTYFKKYVFPQLNEAIK